MVNIQQLLLEAVQKGASDLHITTGVPPILRVNGYLEPLEYPPLRREDTKQLVYSFLNDLQKTRFETDWELDLSVELKDVGRFRVNVHIQRGSVEAAFRVVNDEIRTIKQLGLPPIVGEFARKMSGFVLITGPTGSGKTTTLAALVNQINCERRCMIVTIEDPIEYVHHHRKSIVKQREVTSDTKTFGTALRHVLRQDPDVICIGEMRDLETISTALTAAETGHLIFSTLHTTDVIQTIDRIIDVFPPHQQQQVRIQLANTLEGIVAQQLIPIPGGRGRVVAAEVLVANIAIRKIIRSAKTEQLVTLLQTGYEQGMVTMDKALKNLYQQGLISYDDAITRCKYPESFDSV
jgi:twitching motility protein PilT